MKRHFVAALACASLLALTACSTDTAEDPATASATESSATSGVVSVADDAAPAVKFSGATPELTAWAEKKHQQWVDFYTGRPNGQSSDRAILIPTPDSLDARWARTIEWGAPKPGELIVTVRGTDFSERDLHMVSSYVLGVLSNDYEPNTTYDVKRVFAVTENGIVQSVDDVEHPVG